MSKSGQSRSGVAQSHTELWRVPNVYWHRPRKKWMVAFSIGGTLKYYGYRVFFRDACELRNEVAEELGASIVHEAEIRSAETEQILGTEFKKRSGGD